jgi:hypothetical protein
MKNCGKLLPILAFTMSCLFCGGLVLAQEAKTNEVFVTTDGSMLLDASGNYQLPPELFAAAARAPECRAAELDTNGNWGNPVGEFQLSIRLAKKDFKQGESVVATVIIRNLSTSNTIWYVPEMASDRYFQIHLFDAKTNVIHLRSFRESPTFEEKLSHIVNSPMRWTVGPHLQRKWEVDLGNLFDLSAPGMRLLEAQQNIYPENSKTNIVVKSGLAPFEIMRPAK